MAPESSIALAWATWSAGLVRAGDLADVGLLLAPHRLPVTGLPFRHAAALGDEVDAGRQERAGR